ncbi:hypothetical protein VB152_09030 [Xanthomonas fragariae]|nr:hypothetical protein [Xanthomonas fragariae]
MGGNCKKPAFSVANTGSSGTPVQTSRPCGRWVVGVFQVRRINLSNTVSRRFSLCAGANPVASIDGFRNHIAIEVRGVK